MRSTRSALSFTIFSEKSAISVKLRRSGEGERLVAGGSLFTSEKEPERASQANSYFASQKSGMSDQLEQDGNLVTGADARAPADIGLDRQQERPGLQPERRREADHRQRVSFL